MDQSWNRSNEDLYSRVSNGLTRWVLGWGFLTFHATVFTIAMIAMVLWNFYDSPGDIWVDGVFRRWGAVLAFHAIAVAAGLTAWRLIRAEQQALMSEEAQWSVPVQPADPALAAPSYSTAAVAAAPSTASRALATYKSADAAFGRALAVLATWSAAFARRSATELSARASELSSRFAKDAGQSTASDPLKTWPAGPVRHLPEDEEFISRFGGGDRPATNDSSPRGTASGVDVVLDVTGFSTDDRRSGAPPVTKEPGQTWVQAATYSWHVPHDPPAPVSQNGHPEPPPGITPPAAND